MDATTWGRRTGAWLSLGCVTVHPDIRRASASNDATLNFAPGPLVMRSVSACRATASNMHALQIGPSDIGKGYNEAETSKQGRKIQSQY